MNAWFGRHDRAIAVALALLLFVAYLVRDQWPFAVIGAMLLVVAFLRDVLERFRWWGMDLQFWKPVVRGLAETETPTTQGQIEATAATLAAARSPGEFIAALRDLLSARLVEPAPIKDQPKLLAPGQFRPGPTSKRFEAVFQFKSADLAVQPGSFGTFSAFYANLGTESWIRDTSTEVVLGIASKDGAVLSWSAGWPSDSVFAVQTRSVVPPGDFTAFTFNVRVPSNATIGSEMSFCFVPVLRTTGEVVGDSRCFQARVATSKEVEDLIRNIRAEGS